MKKLHSTVKSVFEAVLLIKFIWDNFDMNTGRPSHNHNRYNLQIS